MSIELAVEGCQIDLVSNSRTLRRGLQRKAMTTRKLFLRRRRIIVAFNIATYGNGPPGQQSAYPAEQEAAEPLTFHHRVRCHSR